MKIKKHKKLLYVPGMFSLLVIPFVFLFYASNYLKENDFRFMGVIFPEKNYFENYPQYNYRVGYDYDTIQVSTNFSKEAENQYFNLIKELQKKNIDKTGIIFQLSDENTYGDFVKLNNLMLLTEQDVYATDIENDGFYVIHDEIDYSLKEITPIYCGFYYQEGKLSQEKIILNVKEFFKTLPNFMYLILIGYFTLVLCAIFRPKIFIPIPFKTNHDF